MMDVFAVRDELVTAYERFTRSFVRIQAPDIKAHVNQEYAAGRFWPAPLVQLNPAFVPGGDIGQFVREGLLNPGMRTYLPLVRRWTAHRVLPSSV
jgi:hypothetical protein